MNWLFRKFAIATAAILVGVGGATAGGTDPMQLAQAAPAKPAAKAPAAAQPKPAEGAAAAPAAAPGPVRTEIVAYDGWSVTCREFAEPKPKRVCSATIQLNQQNSGQVVFGWTIQMTDEGRYEAVIRTPTGVLLGAGVELKLGTLPVRKVGYTTCEPTYCTASFAMDPAFVRDASSVEAAEVTMTGSVGNRVQVNVPLKGADRAIAALRR